MSYLGSSRALPPGNASLGRRTAAAESLAETSISGKVVGGANRGAGRSLVRDHRSVQGAPLNEIQSSFLMNAVLKGDDFIEEQKSIDETSVKDSKLATPEKSRYR